MEDVIIGLELKDVGNDKYLVLGIIGFFSAHRMRFKSIDECADILAPWPVKMGKVPMEEGWHNVGDLPKHLWQELHAKIYDRRKALALATGKKIAPGPKGPGA